MLYLAAHSSLLIVVLWGGWQQFSADGHEGYGCRSLRFTKLAKEYAPQRYVFKEIYLPMGTELNGDCRYECVLERTCVSVNIGPPNETGFRLCQLIDSDHTQHREDNETRKGFIHWSTENPCHSNPCLHNATCLNGFTDKKYICLCPVSYTGENCEKDKNECTENTHDCPAEAICNNTEGSYRCSCREGYQGDGRNCTDVDECKINTHGCHNNASCYNTEGSHTCKCKRGFNCTFKAVFTNLNATGRYGPTTLGSHYTGQDHDGQVTLSSSIQKWIVPYTGDYRIEAIGAAGGYDSYPNSTQYRGRGARLIGTFRLNKEEVIHILVGQEGAINKLEHSSGGGGGTFVVRGTDAPLMVAGGGGGVHTVNSRHAGCDASRNTTGNGGHRSRRGGEKGRGAQTFSSGFSGGGGGGFYSSGRSGQNFNGTRGKGGEGGKGFLQGGVGGRAMHNDVHGGFGGGGGAAGRYRNGGAGGGGGGYSGGGSGDNKDDSCGGGGGSFNDGINQQIKCCYNSAGHGNVTITLL